MPNINTMKNSRFLKKEDCGQGLLVTIRSCQQMNVAAEGALEDMKWCLLFDEVEKPMVTNATNRQIIAQFTGLDDTDDWGGHKIVIFNNPNVSFQGKLTGGIGVRAPRPQPSAPQSGKAPARMPAEKIAQMPSDEDVPF